MFETWRAIALTVLSIGSAASPATAQAPAGPVAASGPSRHCDIDKRYYPEKAQRMGVPGKVLLDCKLEPSGKLSDCRVTSESPQNLGFGDAALCMTPLMRMRTVDKTGVSQVGKRVPVPINFHLPQ